MVPQSVVVCLVLLAAATATEVEQCKGRSAADNSNSTVELSPCKHVPCKLKKGTEQHITINFTTDSEVREVTNSVKADVFGVDLPFVGVDGNSVCDKIYNEAGESAPCPLKAGTTYTYKDSFPILAVYPTIRVYVKWALQVGDDKQLVCFGIPAKITAH